MLSAQEIAELWTQLEMRKVARDVTLRYDLYQKARRAAQPVSKAQADAGNFRKGHASIHGLRLSIEVRKNGVRRGFSREGKPWERVMTCHYGYVRGFPSAKDGDHVDIFVGPHPESELVFVVDQRDREGNFDEHKGVLGCRSLKEARELYLSNYPAGWTGLQSITPLTLDQFKAWLADGDREKPLAQQTLLLKAGAEDGAEEGQPVVVVISKSTTVQFLAPGVHWRDRADVDDEDEDADDDKLSRKSTDDEDFEDSDD